MTYNVKFAFILSNTIEDLEYLNIVLLKYTLTKCIVILDLLPSQLKAFMKKFQTSLFNTLLIPLMLSTTSSTMELNNVELESLYIYSFDEMKPNDDVSAYFIQRTGEQFPYLHPSDVTIGTFVSLNVFLQFYNGDTQVLTDFTPGKIEGSVMGELELTENFFIPHRAEVSQYVKDENNVLHMTTIKKYETGSNIEYYCEMNTAFRSNDEINILFLNETQNIDIYMNYINKYLNGINNVEVKYTFIKSIEEIENVEKAAVIIGGHGINNRSLPHFTLLQNEEENKTVNYYFNSEYGSNTIKINKNIILIKNIESKNSVDEINNISQTLIELSFNHLIISFNKTSGFLFGNRELLRQQFSECFLIVVLINEEIFPVLLKQLDNLDLNNELEIIKPRNGEIINHIKARIYNPIITKKYIEFFNLYNPDKRSNSVLYTLLYIKFNMERYGRAVNPKEREGSYIYRRNKNSNLPFNKKSVFRVNGKINILVATDYSNIHSISFRNSANLFFSKNNAINGFSLNLIELDIGITDSSCFNVIDFELKNAETAINAIFTTAGKFCRNLLIRTLNTSNVVLFAFDQISGEEIDENIMSCDLSVDSLKISLDYFLVYPYRRFSLIVEEGELYSLYSLYIENYLAMRGGIIVVKETINANLDNLTLVAESFTNIYKSGIVLLLLTPNLHILLDNSFQILQKTNEYSFYSFFTNEEVRGQVSIPFYKIRSTADTVHSDEILEFKANLLNLAGENTVITQQSMILYSVMNYWKAGLMIDGIISEENGELKIESMKIRKALNSIRYKSMIGNIHFENNNGLSLPLLLIGTDDVILYRIDQVQYIVWSIPINNGIYRCDLFNDEIGKKYKVPLLKIGILTRLFGTDENPQLKDQIFLGGILFSIDLVNTKIGSKNTHFFPYVQIVKSDNYKQDLTEFMKRIDIEIYMGGTTTEEKIIIEEVASVYKKYWFYLGINNDQICSKYVISYSMLPNQILESFIKAFSHFNSRQYLFIYGSSSTEEYYHEIWRHFFDPITSLEVKSIKLELENKVEMGEYMTNNPSSMILTFFESQNENLMLFFDVLPINRMVYHIMADNTVETMFIDNTRLNNNFFILFWSAANADPDSTSYIKAAEMFLTAFNNNNFISNRISGPTELSYSILLSFLKAKEATGSTNIDIILNYLYDRTISVPSGSIILKENHYVSRRIYVVKMIDGKEIIEYGSAQLISPNPWNTLYNATNIGRYCSWTGTETGSYLYKPTKVIVYIAEAGYNYIYDTSSQYVYISVNYEKHNSNGGSYGFEIHPHMMFLNFEKEVNKDEFIKQITPLKTDLVFGCVTEACRFFIEEYTIPNKIIFFSFTRGDMKFCSQFSIFGRNSENQRSQFLIDFALEIGATYIYAVVSTEAE